MFLRESVQHCERCRERTPHSRRVVPWAVLVGAALLAVGLVSCSSQRAELAGVACWGAGLWLIARDRERSWRIACERCRWKTRWARRQAEREGVRLIDPF